MPIVDIDPEISLSMSKTIFEALLERYDEFSLDDEEIEDLINAVESLRSRESSWSPSRPSSDTAVWRYVNFTQLMSILERDSVWFSNVNNFNDPYEGTIPRRNLENEIQQIADSAGVPENIARMAHHSFTSGVRYSGTGCVSCWNISQYESAALWEQYIESSEGVAIQTTVENLESAFSDSERDLVVGEIDYINYDRDTIPDGMLPTLYHKRESFEHEKEFRVSFLPEDDEEIGAGEYINIDKDILIDRIYLAPTSKDWFYNLVESVLDTYSVDCEIVKSDIYSDPVY